MKHIISFLGHKGGTGKSTCSHLAAIGLAELGYGVIHASTDSSRLIRSSENRKYGCLSARTEAELKTLIEKFKELIEKDNKNIFLIIDGGANKRDLDEDLAKISDLVIVPTKDGFNDLDAAVIDVKRLPNSYALRSMWPYAYLRYPISERKLAEAFVGLENRIFDHTILSSENTRVVDDDTALESLRKGKNVARSFAFSIKAHLCD
jgi:chromosome partitioning protein